MHTDTEAGRDAIRDRFMLATAKQDAAEMYREAVVYVVSHDSGSGAVGIVCNKPLAPRLLDVMDPARDVDLPVTWSEFTPLRGGSRCQDVFWALCPASALPSAPEDSVRYQLLATANEIRRLTRASVAPVAVGVGLSLWRRGELEAEVADGLWEPLPPETDLFDVPPARRRASAMAVLAQGR